MRIVETHNLVFKGSIRTSIEWQTARSHVHQAILATDWPHGSGKFTIRPESGK